MTPTTLGMNGALRTYVEEVHDDHPALLALRDATDRLADAGMRSSLEQCRLLALLLRAIGAKEVVEVGCFTGVGTLAMALALPEDGRVTTLDVNDDWAAIGREHWRAAGVEEKVAFTSGPAADSLDALIAERGPGSVDLVYVDADKKNYPLYLERAKVLTRKGGLIALDNLFWDGAIADPEDRSRQVEGLREATRSIARDPNYFFALAPIGDGLGLGWKR